MLPLTSQEWYFECMLDYNYGFAFRTMFPMDTHAYTLHTLAFMIPMLVMSSEEQLKKWLPQLRDMTIHGCYAQTELSHGKTK